MLKTIASTLQNFFLINGISSIVDEDALISDLLLADDVSDTQILLTGCKQILDFAVARGLATITSVEVGQYDASGNALVDGGFDVSGVAQPASVKFNYIQSYFTTPTRSSILSLYEVDLTYFYVYDVAGDNNYSKKTNLVLYDNGVTVSNAEYVGEINNVITSLEQCSNLINDIMSGQ
jgi:hypothetical protein